MIKVLVFLIFLLYYFYFYFSQSEPLEKPTHGVANDPESYNPQFERLGNERFRITVNGTSVWEEVIPNAYTFHENRLIAQDVCQNTQDGDKVLATGPVLYNFLKEHPDLEDLINTQNKTNYVVQTGGVFYFTCQNHRIQQLNMCPSGELFVDGRCQSIQSCTKQPDGTVLTHRTNPFAYIRCEKGQEIEEQCPADSFFLFNKCFPKYDLFRYCNFFTIPFLLNDTTRVDCVKGKPKFTESPPGFKYFDVNTCESAICDGLPDGTRFPMKDVKRYAFRFFPGYMECQQGRVQQRIYCPQTWDSYLSKGDNLSNLPMVFDGKQCTIPTLCTNVQPIDSEVIVPVHEFSKHVSNWGQASFYDTLAGYTCEGARRKRVLLDPGEHVSKKFKRELACNERERVPLFKKWNQYYDCKSGTVQSCNANEQFDGFVCHPKLSHPFRYNGMELFQLDHLSFDNWIVPWNYSKIPTVEPCQDLNDVYLNNYNICSHPDCVLYSFLSQIPSLSILLPDKNHKCSYDKQKRHLQKEPLTFPKDQFYHYWSQRLVSQKTSVQSERCTPSQHLKTGNFVWDQLLFATCNPEQPFVFCPSSFTEGILELPGGKFHCRVPTDTSEFNSSNFVSFELNELKRIHPTLPHQKIFIDKKLEIYLPNKGFEPSKRVELNVTDPVILEYNYRVTHPPDVVYHDGKYIESTQKGAFLMKRAGFTSYSVNFPEYNVESSVSTFETKLYN